MGAQRYRFFVPHFCHTDRALPIIFDYILLGLASAISLSLQRLLSQLVCFPKEDIANLFVADNDAR